MTNQKEFLELIAEVKAIVDAKLPAAVAEAVQQGRVKSGGHKVNVQIFAAKILPELVVTDPELAGAIGQLWCANWISEKYREDGEIEKADEIKAALGDWPDNLG